MDIVLSEQDLVMRKIRIFLKGRVVGFSIKGGKKYFSSRPESEDFEKGRKSVDELPLWTGVNSVKVMATISHIIHNATRHNRGHLGGTLQDSEFLRKYVYDSKELVSIIKKIYGESSVEFLKNHEATKNLGY